MLTLLVVQASGDGKDLLHVCMSWLALTSGIFCKLSQPTPT